MGFPADYISLSEAHALGYGHPNTLRKYINSGELPARRTRRSFEVSRADLDAWSAPVPVVPSSSDSGSPDDLLAAAKRVAAAFPPRTPEQKADVAFILNAGRQHAAEVKP